MEALNASIAAAAKSVGARARRSKPAAKRHAGAACGPGAKKAAKKPTKAAGPRQDGVSRRKAS